MNPIAATIWPREAGEIPEQGRWTYEDYCRLPDDGRRYEVLGGELYVSPAPSWKHQAALRNLSFLLGLYLEEHPLGTYGFAPIDVILPGGLATPVQPDLIFLVNERRHLIQDQVVNGAPDLIVEILSPSSEQVDRRTKLNAYAKAGVREYWLADPIERFIEVLVLRNGFYKRLGKFHSGDRVRSKTLPGFEPSIDRIFAE